MVFSIFKDDAVSILKGNLELSVDNDDVDSGLHVSLEVLGISIFEATKETRTGFATNSG